MRQIGAVIQIFDPAYNLRAISTKRRNVGNPWFKRGILFRAALDVLRQAGEPLSTLEIAADWWPRKARRRRSSNSRSWTADCGLAWPTTPAKPCRAMAAILSGGR